MAHFHNPNLAGAGGQGGYQIERSLRFNSADSAYLVNSSTRTVAAGAYTFSFWIKRCALGNAETVWSSEDGSGLSVKWALAGFGPDNIFYWWHYSNADANAAQSNGVLRDTSAWYHIVLSKPASAAGTLYINGVAQTKQTSFTADADAFANAKYIGRRYDGTRYSNCYLTEFYGIDGQALTPSSFGETDTITGVWKPKKYSGSGYGTSGFYLNFKDNSSVAASTLGKDYSGNGNNWTPSATFSVTAGAGNDSLIDTPTPYADGGNGRGNYATLNAVDKNANITPSNGNLDIVGVGTVHRAIRATIAVSSGKWYWEATVNSYISGLFGIAKNDLSLADGNYVGSNATSWGYLGNGNKYNNGSAAAYGASFTTGDVIGVALDADNGTLVFYKNNVSQGTAYTGLTSGPYFPAVSTYSASDSYSLNFGQRAFSYTVPAGFKALNTQNLPEPSIKKPSSYFDTLLYTGNSATSSAGTTARTLTGLGFQPDLIWVKSRNNGGTWSDHSLTDTIRGANLSLSSNTTGTETNVATGFSQGGVGTSTSDGFTIVSGTAGGTTNLNSSSGTYVAWCWDESATPGFDIVTWVGTAANLTLNHSLGVAPKMMIVKSRTQSVTNWCVYHEVIGNTKADAFNRVDGPFINVNYWNNTSPTASNFTVGTGADSNGSGHNMVAYLFSEVAGFSKFGSYTGNSSTDGPFVFCGFRPALILMRRIDGGSESWSMWDNKRAGYNAAQYYLAANSTSIEDTTAPGVNSNGGPDFLSNGFKMRSYAGSSNNSGTYVFAAWAETPFKYGLAR